MKAEFFKDLSDASYEVEIVSGKTIKESFPEIDFAKHVIICNGELTDEHHIVLDTDLIVIRSIPMGWTAAMIAVTSILTLGAVAASIYMGVKIQKMKQELAGLTSTSTISDEVINNPTLAGASNSVATGKTQPYVIGRNLFTPYIMNKGNGSAGQFRGYHSFDGPDGFTQFYNVVLECGFNKQIIERLNADDITIRTFAPDKQNGVFPIVGNSIFATNNSFVEIRQDGADFESDEFKTKIIEETIGQELPKKYDEDYEDVFLTLAKNSMAADVAICFPNGLRAYSTSGGKLSRSVTVKPYYSLNYAQLVANGDANANANATWVPFTFTNSRLISETKTETKGVYNVDFKPADYGADIPHDPLLRIPDDLLLNIALLVVGPNNWTLYQGTDVRGSDYESKLINATWISSNTYRIVVECTHTEIETEKEIIESNTFTNNTTRQPYYKAHVDFNYADVAELQHPITIKLVDDSVDPDGVSAISQTMDTVQVAWVQSVLYDTDQSASAESFVKEAIIDEKERALSTLLGVKLEATASNESKLGKLNIITNGLCRTWNGSAWSTNKEASTNLAAWVLEVLSSDTHKPSQCDDDEIDLEAFGDWYEFCETNNIHVNMVLTDGVTKQSILEDMCKIGHASLYNNIYGKISVGIDKAKDNAIALLNSQNIISIDTTRDISRRVDGIKMTYTDEAAGFVENTYLVMKEGKTRDENSVITSQSVKGITNYKEIIKYARREMAVEELRPDVINVTVGMEGVYYTPWSKVLLQSNSLLVGLGNAEIKSVKLNTAGTQITGLTFYEPVEYDAEDSDGYGLIIQCVSLTYCTTIEAAYRASSNGRVSEIVFVTPISATASVIPHAHDIVSFGKLNNGSFNTITNPYLITSIQKSGDNIQLSLVDYNEAIYDSGTIPEYLPNLTRPSTPLKNVENDFNELTDEMQAVKKDAIKNSVPKNIVQYWAASESNSIVPSIFSTDPTSSIATMTNTLRYLWTYTINEYNDGTSKQVCDPYIVGVYGDKGEAGSGYILDLSPEQITLLNTYIDTTNSALQIKASFFNDDEDLHASTTFVAKIENMAVGTWEDAVDGKVVTIPCTALRRDVDLTNIIIMATYNGITRSALATVSKIYSGQDAVMYKMLFSSTNVKVDAEGERIPEQVVVQKRKVNANGESNTNKGFVTVSIDGADEIKTNCYNSAASSDYKAGTVYYKETVPFFLYTDESKSFVLGNGINPFNSAVVGGVFYK